MPLTTGAAQAQQATEAQLTPEQRLQQIIDEFPNTKMAEEIRAERGEGEPAVLA